MADAAGIAIFAKAPVAGFAKTRLIPLLGAKRAATLQRELLEQAIDVAVRSNLGPVSLWCTPDCEDEAFQTLAANFPVKLHPQLGLDLGARMLNAFEVLTVQYPLLIIGTDCPSLTPAHVVDCARALRKGADVVLLPTEDGGYALIGAKAAIPSLFGDIAWGTDQVMAQTRSHARRAGLLITEPAVLWDIDTPADYNRALAEGLIKPAV